MCIIVYHTSFYKNAKRETMCVKSEAISGHRKGWNSFHICFQMHITTTFGKTNSKAENRVAQCLINWIWLANKTLPCAPEGSLRGQGPGPWSRQTASIPCFLQNTNGWNSYFSNVNFPLQSCHLQHMAQRVQRERARERKTGYILYHFLFCQAMSFWPCSWYASVLLSILSLALLYAIVSLSHWCCFFFFLNLSASLYLSPSIFISLFSSHTPMAALQLAAGMGASCGLSWVSLLLPPFAPGDSPEAASPSTSIFDHTVKRECFLLLLDHTFKKPSPSPCLSVLHVRRKLGPRFSNQKC